MGMKTDNPLQKIIPIIKGYHSENPLLEKEINLIYYLIAGRLCTSILNSSYGITLDPEY